MIGTFRRTIVSFDSSILDPPKNTKLLGFGPLQIKILYEFNCLVPYKFLGELNQLKLSCLQNVFNFNANFTVVIDNYVKHNKLQEITRK